MATDIVLDLATQQIATRELEPPPLNERKLTKWESVKARRDAAIDAGVPVSGIGTFDSDEPSRLNISGAVTGAMIAKSQGAPFAIDWKLADNSIVTLGADQMIAVGMTVMQYVAACHARAQTLGVAIEAAEGAEALDAIDITTGWPGDDA